MDGNMRQVTCTAPVNIAVIKYWGKRDENLILPINASLSGTLEQSQLRAKTTIMASSDFKQDRMWLNGREQPLSNPRVQNVLKDMRMRACRKRKLDGHQRDLTKYKLHICSENNFPTAAGLASSAAGYACLVYSLAKLYGVEGDISAAARQGSGSACRSIDGGFVEWEMGEREDGSDSLARQVYDQAHWPEMRVLILVVSGRKKHTGSTAGMQTSVKTSELLQHRAETLVPRRMREMKAAIRDRDFAAFAEITMKDSNEMHACCLDTYPPISYMVDTSHDIQRLVHAINAFYGEPKVCYTYDAGPNACLYLLEKNVPMVLSAVQAFFPPGESENGEAFVRGIQYENKPLEQGLRESIPLPVSKGSVQYIISTKLGAGPQKLSEPSDSLLGKDGLPKHLAE